MPTYSASDMQSMEKTVKYLQNASHNGGKEGLEQALHETKLSNAKFKLNEKIVARWYKKGQPDEFQYLLAKAKKPKVDTPQVTPHVTPPVTPKGQTGQAKFVYGTPKKKKQPSDDEKAEETEGTEEQPPNKPKVKSAVTKLQGIAAQAKTGQVAPTAQQVQTYPQAVGAQVHAAAVAAAPPVAAPVVVPMRAIPLGDGYPRNILRGEAPKRALWRGIRQSYDYQQRQPFIARRRAALLAQQQAFRRMLGWTHRVSERRQLPLRYR